MTPAITVRRATPQDAALLAALNAPIHALHVAARPDIFRPLSGDDPALIQFFADALACPDDVIFILEQDGTPAGYVYARIVRRPENLFTCALDDVLVDQLSVSPPYQGRGHGAQLMQAAEAFAREGGFRRVALDVWAFNDGAQAFYDAQGFTAFSLRLEKVPDR